MLEAIEQSRANILAQANAGWRVAQADLTPESLAQMLTGIFDDPEGLARRAAAANVPRAGS